MAIAEFKRELEALGIEVKEEQLKQLEIYLQLLIEWNQKINLTAIVEPEQIYLKHFYDSLTLNKIISLEKQSHLCDIGTGAGFPGIVIKIFFPHIQVTLVDSLQKRITFLKLVIETLGLEKIEAVHARAEEFAKNNKEQYDLVTARAVAHLSLLLEYGIPMVQVGKYLIAMKGNALEELEESKQAQKILSCRLLNKVEFELPNHAGNRTLLLFQKVDQTNAKYPRKYSEIKKNRL